VAVAALVLAGAGLLWLRDSSLVAVDHVAVTGATGRSAADIRSALRRVGSTMTVLHVRKGDLRQAVARYPIVKDLEVSTDFPHTLVIRVIPHNAVAYVTVGGRRVPVARDGTLLRDARMDPELPAVSGQPAAQDDHLTDRATLDEVALLGAAPRAMRSLVDGVRRDDSGLHVHLRSGPRLDFGRATRLQAKWISAARVLGDPRAAGAAYVDLSTPDRPVAGTFPDGVAPAAEELPGAAPVPAAAPQEVPDA
jgi:cell division protein FtsQ